LEPTKDRDDTWRIKTNDELNNLIRNNNISFYIKAQRLSWFGHVDQMTNEWMIKYEWKQKSSRLAGRPNLYGKMVYKKIQEL
jgi:hypothetical protein